MFTPRREDAKTLDIDLRDFTQSIPLTLLSWFVQETIIMSVNWIKDADEALSQAKEQNKPLLIDFSAAPS